jgi:hypothetical protein
MSQGTVKVVVADVTGAPAPANIRFGLRVLIFAVYMLDSLAFRPSNNCADCNAMLGRMKTDKGQRARLQENRKTKYSCSNDSDDHDVTRVVTWKAG